MSADYNGEIHPGDEVWENRTLDYWGIDVDSYEPRYEDSMTIIEFRADETTF